jgi:hypothetical protein
LAERRSWSELAASAFVSGKLTIGIDLTLEDVEDAGARSNRFELRVAGASEEAIGLKLLERMEPFLPVIVEHVFVVHDGNVEELQSSADRVSDVLDVVGLNAFELLHEFFEFLDGSCLVTSDDAELLDIGLLVLGKLDRVRMRGREPKVPAFVESWKVSSARRLADFSG